MTQNSKNTKIDKPQVFVIYEPGMFGTYLCLLFDHFPGNNNIMPDSIKGDRHGINAHDSGYVDHLERFHIQDDLDEFHKFTEEQKIGFFQTSRDCVLGVHRCSRYGFGLLDLDRYFNNHVKVILWCDDNDLKIYSDRMYDVSPHNVYTNRHWYKQLGKNLDKIPKDMLESLIRKDYHKWITDSREQFNLKYQKSTNDIFFNIRNIADHKKVQHLIDSTMEKLQLEPFELPMAKHNEFIERNAKYFDFAE